MILDLIFIVLLLLFMLRGYRKGVVIALFSALAIILGVLAALKLSGTLSMLLLDTGGVSGRWVPLVSYALVFLIVLWLIKLIAGMLQKSLEFMALGWANRLAGALLYGFLVCFAFSAVLWIMVKMAMLQPETQMSSRIFPLLAPLAPALYDWIGQAIPIARSAFQDLEQFFDHLNETLPEHVGPDR